MTRSAASQSRGMLKQQAAETLLLIVLSTASSACTEDSTDVLVDQITAELDRVVELTCECPEVVGEDGCRGEEQALAEARMECVDSLKAAEEGTLRCLHQAEEAFTVCLQATACDRGDYRRCNDSVLEQIVDCPDPGGRIGPCLYAHD